MVMIGVTEISALSNCKTMNRLVNFRLFDFFIFDLRRSLSPDLHESCDFKLKNRSLEKPKKAYFMKICQNLYFWPKNRPKFTKKMGHYWTFDGKRLNFMQSARQNSKIICCVLSKLHNYRLKINWKNLFLRN